MKKCYLRAEIKPWECLLENECKAIIIWQQNLCIGWAVYLDTTNAFTSLSVHSYSTLLVKRVIEIKLTLSLLIPSFFSFFCSAFEFSSHTEKD